MIIDVREAVFGEIDGYRFDNSSDIIRSDGNCYICIQQEGGNERRALCEVGNAKNLIKAIALAAGIES